MFLNFAAAIRTLGEDAGYRIASAARPPAAYLWAQVLPEENRPTYEVKSGAMTVRSLMAGLVGMDAPYPPTGYVDVSTFLEQSAKIANEVTLPEGTLRMMQQQFRIMGISDAATTQALVVESLNFLNKVIVQGHLDTMEWLRGQALVTGAIDWTFNAKRLQVNYGVPAGNFLPSRTGTAHYGGSASAFWSDVTLLRQKLNNNVRFFAAHPTTINLIRYNPVNQLVTVGEGGGSVTFRRWAQLGGGTATNAVLSPDTGDTVTIVSYGLEGEILNPANPQQTIIIPFLTPGKLVAIGNNASAGYVPGMGSATENPLDANRVGYTHIAPTVEGGGRMGRWTRLFTPESRPWQLRAEGVTNGLPVLEAPTKVAVATTALS